MHNLKFIIILFMITIYNCKESEFILQEVDPASKPAIMNAGHQSANLLVVTLKSKVIEAIGQGGPLNAVTVCNKQGLILTDSIARHTRHVLNIRRTSYKYRNPKNRPDTIDREVLNSFVKADKADKPRLYRVIQGDSLYYRYYQPLKIGGLCVTCHGKPETMDKMLVEKIKQVYPGDMAQGYGVGDFRGVVCVSIEEIN